MVAHSHQKKDAEGNAIFEDTDNKIPKYQGGFTADEIKAFNIAMQQAKMVQQQAQFNAQQMCTQYESNVSIWLDAQKSALEAEQDMMLEPLNYEETMLELEKNKKIQDFKESTKKSKHTNNLFLKKSRTQLQPSVSDNNYYHNDKEPPSKAVLLLK